MDKISERRALQPPFATFFARLISKNVAFNRRRGFMVRSCYGIAAAVNLAQAALAWQRHSGFVWLSFLPSIIFLTAILLPFRTIVREGVTR